MVKQLVQAHAYWRMKGLAVDLVILSKDASVSSQSLHDEIISLIVSGREAETLDKPAGIFVRSLEQISDEDRVLLQSVARIVLTDENGTLAERPDILDNPDPRFPTLTPTQSSVPDAPRPLAPRELIFIMDSVALLRMDANM